MNAIPLTLTRPDDWHLHLRDGDIMAAVLPDTARRFARAIIMPNLKPPVTTTEQALAYRARHQDIRGWRTGRAQAGTRVSACDNPVCALAGAPAVCAGDRRLFAA